MNNDMNKIDRLLKLFPLYSEDLGIDLSTPSGRFSWFVASILFGARISEQIAAKTYQYFKAAGIVDTPDKIIEAGWDRLVEILDAGGEIYLKGVPYRYTAAEVDLLKGIRPGETTSRKIQFVIDRQLVKDKEFQGRHDPYKAQEKDKTTP